MKKFLTYISVVFFIWLFFDSAHWLSQKVFDSCGSSTKYTSYSWYPDLKNKLVQAGENIIVDLSWSLTDGNWKLDFCYSESESMVVVNVPYLNNQNFSQCSDDYSGNAQKTRACRDILNVFQYNIKLKKLSQAKRSKDILYTSPKESSQKISSTQIYMHEWNNWVYQDADIALATIHGFGKRNGNIIQMTSGYSDAGCWSNFIWWYNFRTNTINLIKKDSWCSN